MFQEHKNHFDWSVVLVTTCLVFVGLINLYSATHGPAGLVGRYFYLQLAYVFLGILVAVACVVVDYRVLERFAYFLYVVMIASLVGVIFFGSVHQGSRSWIDLGPVNWQPMEFGKLGLILKKKTVDCISYKPR